jgi:hypothetical protein
VTGVAKGCLHPGSTDRIAVVAYGLPPSTVLSHIATCPQAAAFGARISRPGSTPHRPMIPSGARPEVVHKLPLRSTTDCNGSPAAVGNAHKRHMVALSSAAAIARSRLPGMSRQRPWAARPGRDHEACERAKVGHAGSPRTAQQRDGIEVDAEAGHRSARGDASEVHEGRDRSIGLGSASMPPSPGCVRPPDRAVAKSTASPQKAQPSGKPTPATQWRHAKALSLSG